ncbi:MAG: endo alpha-1,4 polygalactosaminidase [Bdellovibrio sp.]|nr:endo alpha-1,4 polygalactosaminidase [Bdellovibrio sp.]
MFTHKFKLLFFLFVIGWVGCKKTHPTPVRWYYQLQLLKEENLRALISGPPTLFVLEPFELPAEKFQALAGELKSAGHTLLCYMSIGETGTYRYYYQALGKKIIKHENAVWKGSFRVNYADPVWQSIFVSHTPEFGSSYVERMINLGCQGAYLDIVDAFWDDPKEVKKNAQIMADFVAKIKQHAVSLLPSFLLFTQNATTIYQFLEAPEAFFAAIDGIGIESAFYVGKKWFDNDYAPNMEVVGEFKTYQNHGKHVFSIEYIQGNSKIDAYFCQAQKLGVIPLVADRELTGKTSLYNPETSFCKK